jgi:23S rRNA (cytidine1920-2'-O)/16S rRNA (cytidine1409-2'-O)-methyltransferase
MPEPGRAKRVRLDQLVHQRGLAESRERARRLILAGQVYVDGERVSKVAAPVDPQAHVVVDHGLPYVSRGGLKLERALDAFGLDPTGLVVSDVGASTGGFTDCLLQRGAARVYAIDVGYGQLAWTLRQDPRVVVMERTNARHLESLPEPVHLATIDVSFISLRLILPQVRRWLTWGASCIPLIKPQFEAGRAQVGKGGVVRDAATHRSVVSGVIQWATSEGWRFHGVVASPIVGPSGNVEFLAWLSVGADQTEADPQAAVAVAVDDAHGRSRSAHLSLCGEEVP